MFGKFPFLQKLFADGGYQGPQFRNAQKNALPFVDTKIVKRSDAAKREAAMSLVIVDDRLVVKLRRADTKPVVALGDARRNRSSFKKVSTNLSSSAGAFPKTVCFGYAVVPGCLKAARTNWLSLTPKSGL